MELQDYDSIGHCETHKRGFTGTLAYLFLVIAPLCWAANVVLARGVIHLIAPVSLAFWRWLIAFLILLPFTWTHIRQDWKTAIRPLENPGRSVDSGDQQL